jgi:CheY-like chemotaxis protein
MDDEEAIRQLAHDILTPCGYQVVIAKDGAEAIELFKKAKKSRRPFHAVILDLTVPGGMGGKETIEKLLAIDRNVKAIVSSGYSNDPIMADFREYGFRAVVAKPYDIRELAAIVHRVISGEPENSPPL